MAFLKSAREVIFVYITAILALCFVAVEIHMVDCMLCYLFVEWKYYDILVLVFDAAHIYHLVKRLYGGYDDGLTDWTGNKFVDLWLEHMALVIFPLLGLAACSAAGQLWGITMV